MKTSYKILIAMGIIVLAAGTAFGLSKLDTGGGGHVHPPGTPAHSHNDDNGHDSANEEQETASLVIIYTSTGFEKSIYTVTAGDKVQIQNNSGSTLDFNSDPHPVHTAQSELNVGEIQPGEAKIFTVNTKGNWGFHNHLNQAHKSTLKVE